MTEIITAPERVSEQIRQWKHNHRTVGFVPSMGAYHRGHRALMRSSVEAHDKTVVSLFVNPTQFPSEDDVRSYPRDFSSDIEVLEQEQVDLLFRPDAADLYPEGDSTTITVDHPVTRRFEGKNKSGFFQGVARVLVKLFNLIPADSVYFGEKDLQQLCLVRLMIRDLHFQHRLRMVPTVRDQEGIAYSSRNQQFTQENWQVAREVMEIAQKFVDNADEDNRTKLASVRERLSRAGIDLDYFDVVRYPDFERVKLSKPRAIVIFAGRIGSVRIKDNLPIQFKSIREMESKIDMSLV